MTRHDEIRRSYRELGEFGNLYDGIITRSTLLGKLMDSLVWGLDKELSLRWIDDALAPIPEDFSGSLLEVPVGTGVLTMPLYASLPEAKESLEERLRSLYTEVNVHTVRAEGIFRCIK